jgi:hypothetical protein
VSRFVSRSIRLSATLTLGGPVADVFELFSPLGEKLWVPGWDPELLHPHGVAWATGQIFRTREELGDAVWVVTRLDRAAHAVEYHRVEAGRYVARVEVRCAAASDRTTEATTTYEFVGLSERGNADIAVMTDEAYAEKMARWKGWIDAALARRGA